MSTLLDAWIWLLAMMICILLSGLFSGSEAAFFSLPHRERKRLKRSGIAGRIAISLLSDSDRLLSAILFWNLLINMTYFAIASILGGKLRVDPTAGPSVAVGFSFGSLMVIIFLSEMLPKSIAVLSPYRICLVVAAPMNLAVTIVSPVLPLVKTTNLAASRLLWPSFRPEPEIDLADIERAIELGTDDAALLQRERLVLQGLVEMAETRVGEWMRLRSKLMLCKVSEIGTSLPSESPPGGYMMVTDCEGDTITGVIPLRLLRPSQMDDMAGAMEPVIYAPWSARISQVLDQLKDEDRSVAVVVNEFGEALGAVTMDDILRRVFAARRDLEDETLGEASIQELAPAYYRVFGSVSARALSKHLGIETREEGVTTVAGLIQRHNERLPRVGDEAMLDRYRLRVVEETENGVWIEVGLPPTAEPLAELSQ
ncbi:CNNM domain-containing protein [Novipirellula artificiosorum]|uniref:Magnesium and cobalt efflux protein CorC n=1 Tax=Novipirellula artificiosorum TaxID=2528016 RepID=A0A5C6E4N7_9BACT|nr:CNNM domain-containing protein [Novipirellula artificiosorum]TWU42119.1 Magnesium and cobalt efflux protein CorC [Novipirellula artificiosorum]